MVGKLLRVPLREIWRNEAADFTPWLQGNIEVLNDVIGLSLSSAEREKAVGTFSVDLVAEDEAGNPVVIENQLEKSNHDHLGKLITYTTAINATAAIWIVSDPRPEHVGAVSWLNEWSPTGFYLLKLEGVRIGDSLCAPLLTLIVGPSNESREVGDTKKQLAQRHIDRYKFWAELLEKAKEKTNLFANIGPSHYSGVGTTAGKRGLSFNYVVGMHDARVELYINRGNITDEDNKAIFDSLATEKDSIEASFGELLGWERLEDRHACRIKKDISLGGYRDTERWPAIQDAMIDSMIRLERAFRPSIAKLPT